MGAKSYEQQFGKGAIVIRRLPDLWSVTCDVWKCECLERYAIVNTDRSATMTLTKAENVSQGPLRRGHSVLVASRTNPRCLRTNGRILLSYSMSMYHTANLHVPSPRALNITGHALAPRGYRPIPATKVYRRTRSLPVLRRPSMIYRVAPNKPSVREPSFTLKIPFWPG